MSESVFAQSEKYGMGTAITHKVYGEKAGEALRAAEEEVKRLEELLSRFIPGSEISRLNASAGIRNERLSDETFEVLSEAVKFSGYRKNCFDVTIGPLVDLWRNAKRTLEAPDRPEIRKALSLVDSSGLILDPEEKTAGLKRKGQSVDLGGIGKGYAADKIIEVFKKHGVKSAFTNFGGNVIVMGAKPDGSPWRVGIQHPREEGLIGAVSLANTSVVTSGDYQRYFFGNDGRRYHHILDPSTGYPSESGLISVSVVTPSSVAADALSTILFVSGMKGAQVLKSFPGTEAILIDAKLNIYITPGLEGCFQAAEDTEVNILGD